VEGRENPMILSTAGKRDYCLVLQCSRIALHSVSVNSQAFRASTHILNVKALVGFSKN
jgi:hypothetical protein